MNRIAGAEDPKVQTATSRTLQKICHDGAYAALTEARGAEENTKCGIDGSGHEPSRTCVGPSPDSWCGGKDFRNNAHLRQIVRNGLRRSVARARRIGARPVAARL